MRLGSPPRCSGFLRPCRRSRPGKSRVTARKSRRTTRESRISPTPSRCSPPKSRRHPLEKPPPRAAKPLHRRPLAPQRDAQGSRRAVQRSPSQTPLKPGSVTPERCAAAGPPIRHRRSARPPPHGPGQSQRKFPEPNASPSGPGSQTPASTGKIRLETAPRHRSAGIDSLRSP